MSHAHHSVLVVFNERLIGSISIADTLRPEAAEATARLRATGLRAVLLSGADEPPIRILFETVPQQLTDFPRGAGG
jgi:cation transport ATPase